MFHKGSVMISSGLCFLGALWLVILPARWISAFFCSVALHEISHICAIKLCGGKIYRVRLRVFGAQIETSQLYWWQEAICSLAGPISGFILLLFASTFPRLALCGLFHSLYNLLPFFPLDGGRAIQSVLYGLVSVESADKASKHLKTISKLAFCILAALACYLLKLGLLPLILLGSQLTLAKLKIPCKDRF